MNLEELEKLMEVSNLYEILGVEKDASGANIKKNYYKLALKYHPDKLPHADEYVKGEASKYFNRVQIAYNILSDKERRARYDTTGVVPEFEGESGDSDLTTNPINEEDIKNFAKEYLDSEQEVEDLIALNEQFEGDINEIMIRAILRENEDEDKVVQIIKDAIEAGKTEEYSKFKSSLTAVQKLRRKKAADREKKQFSKGKNKKEKSPDIGELYQMILAKKEKRGSSFLDDLEARYCKPKKGKKDAVPTDAEIDEIVKKNKQKEGAKTKKGKKTSNTEVIEIFEEEDQLGSSKGKRGKKGNKTSNAEVIEIFDENDQKPNSKGRKSQRNNKSSNAEVIEIN